MPRCIVCKDLDTYSLDLKLSQLCEGIQNGCATCSMLYDGITHFIPPNDISTIKMFVDFALYAQISKHKSKQPTFVEFSARQGFPCVWPRIGPGRDISLTSSNDECLGLAKSWLEKCASSHSQCVSLQDEPCLPTRVIDVGFSSLETCLYIANGCKAKYVALSHCWGSESVQPITTTKDTLEDRVSSIKFNTSSKTFQQAAEVTRRLGIRYLWIDSLCIIQDSKDDWANESEKMGGVYHNATVTLLADAAHDTSQGLFPSSADREALNPVYEIPCETLNGEKSMIRVRPRWSDPSNLRTVSHSGSPLTKSKLSTRGWVLQESKLSPRMLYFAKEEMYWICSTLSRCECKVRPGAVPSNLFRRQSTGPTSDKQFLRDLYMEWPLLVMEFTRRDLTHDSDRLAALSGLAGWMKQHTEDLYLCGLWASDLRFQLVWYSEYPEGPSSYDTHCRFDEPYAPTWSWASVIGPVTYFGRWVTQFGQRYPGYQSYEIDVLGKLYEGGELHPPVEIIDTAIVPSTPNKYGPTSKGSLKLRGHVLPVKYDHARNFWLPSINSFENFDPQRVEIIYDVASEIPEILSAACTADSFVFLFVGTLVPPERMIGITDQVICLLLRLIEGLAPVFKRCGIVTKAGDDKSWKAAVPKQNIVII